jgi:hypothetical protein
MLLIIRVTTTILFSAFLLYSQTPDADTQTANAAVGGSALGQNISMFPLDRYFRPMSDPCIFKLNLDRVSMAELYAGSSGERSMPDLKNFGTAGYSDFSLDSQTASSQKPAPRSKGFNYTHGYMVRHKIHKYASIATLPLFVSELVVGEKLRSESDRDSSLRSTHSALAAGIGVLFGIESVTGVWNMWDARKNPHGRGKRLFHGILMLAADAGFVATAATAPHRDDDRVFRNEDGSSHRAIAYASIGVAAVSYVYMLIAK